MDHSERLRLRSHVHFADCVHVHDVHWSGAGGWQYSSVIGLWIVCNLVFLFTCSLVVRRQILPTGAEG